MIVADRIDPGLVVSLTDASRFAKVKWRSLDGGDLSGGNETVIDRRVVVRIDLQNVIQD